MRPWIVRLLWSYVESDIKRHISNLEIENTDLKKRLQEQAQVDTQWYLKHTEAQTYE